MPYRSLFQLLFVDQFFKNPALLSLAVWSELRQGRFQISPARTLPEQIPIPLSLRDLDRGAELQGTGRIEWL